jgi:hypothetical protein
MKFCKDCRHYRPKTLWWKELFRDASECGLYSTCKCKDEVRIDPVSGEQWITYTSCRHERTMRQYFIPEVCGPEGKHWETNNVIFSDRSE